MHTNTEENKFNDAAKMAEFFGGAKFNTDNREEGKLTNIEWSEGYIRFVNEGEIIGEIPDALKEYADRIVKSWNCHDDLVSALKTLVEKATISDMAFSPAMVNAKIALEKATGKQ